MRNLALFFTFGVSLEDWERNGSLDREINIYKKLIGYFDRIYFVTYGPNDFKFSKRLPEEIVILHKKGRMIPNFFYSFLIPLIYREELSSVSWIKTNQIMGSWSAVLAKLLLRKKLLVRTGYTESLSFVGKNLLQKTMAYLVEFLAYKSANFSIVTSKHQKDYLSKKYASSRIYVVPNGVDTEMFRPAENKNPSEKTRLLFVGRLHPEKNLANLLKAVDGLKNISLRIVGQGKLEQFVLDFQKEHALDLELIPQVPNLKLPESYNQADIYVQPSLYEGSPKTILEAMACGLPVVASDVSGINNMIKHGESGLLSKTNAESIRSAIIRLVQDRPLRQKLGKEAACFVRENYCLSHIIEKETRLYDKHSSIRQ